MLPHKHVAISAAIGAVSWWGTGNALTAAAALTTGVLPDIDHAVDYAYYYRFGTHRLILPLHGYEYAILGAVASFFIGYEVLWIAVISYLVHLLADQSENQTHKLGYSLIFRLWHGFRIEEISTVPEAAVRGRMADLDMLGNLYQRLRNQRR